MSAPLRRDRARYPDASDDPYFKQPDSEWICYGHGCGKKSAYSLLVQNDFHCGHCHGEDVFPFEDDPWHCRACMYAFEKRAIKTVEFEGRGPLRLCPRCDSEQICCHDQYKAEQPKEKTWHYDW